MKIRAGSSSESRAPPHLRARDDRRAAQRRGAAAPQGRPQPGRRVFVRPRERLARRIAPRDEPADPRRARVLRGERRGVDPRPLARAGERRLPYPFGGLHRERARRVVALRRIARRAEAGGHRLHRRRRLPGGALVVEFLPFARPVIDESMIAAVADTLRSRWIVTGPRVQEFETALSQRFGGRTVRTLTSATAAMQVA